MNNGKLTVGELRAALSKLPADLPVVIEGTEWNMPASSVEETDWTETNEDSSPSATPKRVLIIKLWD